MMPNTKFWSLAPSQQDETTLNMYIYGQIKSAATFFGSQDDVVSSEFVEDLNRYPDTKIINVYINSPGGSVFAAAAIYNQLRSHGATVHTWCDGICASAAVGILLAADPGCRHMSKASLLMIHNPSAELRGDRQAFLKTADTLEKVKNTLLNIYVEGTGQSVEQLSQMMDDETYLDYDEAKSYNFVDSATETDTSYTFSNDGSFICNGITMDISATLDTEKLKAHLGQKATTGNNKKLDEGGSKTMTFEEYVASLEDPIKNLVTDAITARVTAREGELVSEHGQTIEAMQQTIDDLTQQVAALTPKDPVQDSIENSLSPEAKALLDQARADAVKAQQEVMALRKKEKFAAFKQTFADYKNLPITDKHIEAMQTLEETSPDMMAELREMFKVANTAMESNFGAKGTNNGTDVGVSAVDRLDDAIKAYQTENPTASYTEAISAVVSKDPTLYDSYRNEMNL